MQHFLEGDVVHLVLASDRLYESGQIVCRFEPLTVIDIVAREHAGVECPILPGDCVVELEVIGNDFRMNGWNAGRLLLKSSLHKNRLAGAGCVRGAIRRST